jgi:hypothetical protein
MTRSYVFPWVRATCWIPAAWLKKSIRYFLFLLIQVFTRPPSPPANLFFRSNQSNFIHSLAANPPPSLPNKNWNLYARDWSSPPRAPWTGTTMTCAVSLVSRVRYSDSIWVHKSFSPFQWWYSDFILHASSLLPLFLRIYHAYFIPALGGLS